MAARKDSSFINNANTTQSNIESNNKDNINRLQMLSYLRTELLLHLLRSQLLQIQFKVITNVFQQILMTLHYSKEWVLASQQENQVLPFDQRNIAVLKLIGLAKFTPHNNNHNSSKHKLQQLKL